MYLETDRLLIRNFNTEDVDDLHRVLSDPLVMHHIEAPYDYVGTREFIRKYGIGENPKVYALVEKSSSRVIGHVVFHEIDQPEIYELGWILGQAYWRRGYAHEASKALLDYGFKKLELHKIVSETNDPIRSLALMKKLGMALEGIQRKHSKSSEGWSDLYWCGILKDEFMNNIKINEGVK